ncbi:K02A2.6-like [Cordylochernes scorpioides]|uniref:K02A2.6-like n=1 Tax=Cordylochernes scorpioides TaxID=51811 RepID=A0ABY6LB42_9ARAC|nr:K02A2.6-like [Cordylochernes scorpioides]
MSIEEKEKICNIEVRISPSDPILDPEITSEEIGREIRDLKNNKASGPDDIPNEIIKVLPDSYMGLLEQFYNRALIMGHYPTIWTKSIIHPIFKSGDKDNPSNYRGIALISNLSKLFTTILRSRLNEWVERRNVIPENQAGFRRGRSSVDLIFTLTTLIQLSLRKKRGKLYVFFVDLRKAFDAVPHSLLWKKLTNLGVSYQFMHAIRNYYEQATVAVRWRGSITENIKIHSGVLQGEPLSPLLFILFMTDLIKMFLNLPRYTPGYIIRPETGRVSLIITALKLTLKYWLRVLSMDTNRLPRICLNRMRQLSCATGAPIGFIKQLSNLLNNNGSSWLTYCNDPDSLRNAIPGILRTAIKQTIQNDLTRITQSKLYSHYRDIYTTFTSEEYFLSELPFPVIRLIAQFRTLSIFFREHHLILLRREDLKCTFCGSGITTEMLHYLIDCAALSEERRKLNDKTGQLCPSFPALINEISKNSHQAHLVLEKEAHPKFFKSRNVPFVMRPNSERKAKLGKKTFPEFEVNEDVLVRDNFSPNRWIEGEITEKLGKCFYRILLRDKRVWRRHAGQIRKNWTLPCPDPEKRLVKKRKSLFVDSNWREGYDTLKNLCSPKLPKEYKYEELIEKLVEYFSPRRSIIVERFMFFGRIQKETESVSEYLVEIKRLASTCGFGEFLKESLRDKLVCGLRNAKIQRRILSEGDVPLARVVEIALSMEAAEKNTRIFHVNEPADSVDKIRAEVRNRYDRVQKRKCIHCGRLHKYLCRFREATCFRCGKRGHLATICRSRGEHTSERQVSRFLNQRKINQIEDQEEEEEESVQRMVFMRTYDYRVKYATNDPPYVIKVRVEDTLMTFEIDTSSCLTLISEKDFKRYLPDVQVKEAGIIVKTYDGTVVPILGEIDVKVDFRGTIAKLRAVVVRGERKALLGREWINVLKIGNYFVNQMPLEDTLAELLSEH